jgi:hypothetical protein
MRWTVAGDSPTCLAKRRALQWVAALGLRSVALITACSLAEVIWTCPVLVEGVGLECSMV